MSRAAHAVPTILLAAALATTAFAPSPAAAPGYADDATRQLLDIEGAAIALQLDEDPATEQALVLEFVTALPDEDHAPRWTREGHAYGTVALGERCSDLGGPADQQLVLDVLATIADADGLDGRIVAYSSDASASVLLAGAATEAGAAALTAVATAGATVDPHHVRFSDGNVARTSTASLDDLLGACTAPFDLSQAARTEDWTARDVRNRAEHLAELPTFLAHDATAASLPGPTVDLWQQLRAIDAGEGPARHLDVSNAVHSEDFGDWTQTDRPLDDFVRHVLVEPDWVYRHGNQVRLSHSWSDTGLTGYAFHGLGTGGYDPFGRIETVNLHLNRTFEQDFDCVPVCVPGPGTGEIGSLELANKHTAPHAPVFTWADAGANSERVTSDDPLNDGSGIAGDESLPGGHGYHSLAFYTDPFEDDAQVVGRVELDGWFQTSRAGGTITPVLMVVTADDTTAVVARGAIDLDFHADSATRTHVAGWKRATVRFDHTLVRLRDGDRLAVVLQSSNVEHFVPGSPQGTVNVATGPVNGTTDTGSVLRVPFDTGWPFGYPFGIE